ncbi:hypothetical protein T10_9611 [Trichinella papuae]|uniref:Uncharacterized protein n=1 Tax=Trichinella papuae TaxID=268474 RepID=A0A0V1N9L0_9BILA|nr:hypothetical protein T10_9611 [Trichinella papuae]
MYTILLYSIHRYHLTFNVHFKITNLKFDFREAKSNLKYDDSVIISNSKIIFRNNCTSRYFDMKRFFDYLINQPHVHVESLIKNLLKCIKILLVINQRIELLCGSIMKIMGISQAVCAALNCGYPFSHVARFEVLDQFESTQQNRSHPGQIKAQLIIIIDKRRLHAWRQISLRKIDEQFLMCDSHCLDVISTSLQRVKWTRDRCESFCHYYLKVV